MTKRIRRLNDGALWCGLTILLLTGVYVGRIEAPVAAQTAPDATARTEIPLELLLSRPMVRGSINGHGPLALLIDPQLATTRITPSLADQLDLELVRTDRGVPQSIVELSFGDDAVSGVQVEVGETTPFVPELGPRGQPDAVLGLSSWEDRLVTIDYPRWQVRVESGHLPEPNGVDVFPLRPSSHELLVDLTVGDHPITCRIDPLFPGGVLLPSTYLAELPLQSEPTDVAPVRTREGVVEVRGARLAASVSVAGRELTAPLVLFGNVGDTGMLGYLALGRLSVTYDIGRGRARLNTSGLSQPDEGHEGRAQALAAPGARR